MIDKNAEPTKLAYAWYVVFVLMLCYTLSFVDRQIIGFLVGPIKQELGVSDTKMGLLQGLAFAVFYTVLGLPIGRLADSKSRRAIIAIGVVFWSLMTAGCSLARSYWTLFATRIG
jgi:predicted MFS family arabinose efflux permease